MQDVALKMLEPVEPGLGARASSVSAYKVNLRSGVCTNFS